MSQNRTDKELDLIISRFKCVAGKFVKQTHLQAKILLTCSTVQLCTHMIFERVRTSTRGYGTIRHRSITGRERAQLEWRGAKGRNLKEN